MGIEGDMLVRYKELDEQVNKLQDEIRYHNKLAPAFTFIA